MLDPTAIIARQESSAPHGRFWGTPSPSSQHDTVECSSEQQRVSSSVEDGLNAVQVSVPARRLPSLPLTPPSPRGERVRTAPCVPSPHRGEGRVRGLAQTRKG